MTLPYANATSGQRAIDDIRTVVQAFGCSKFAPMEDFATGEVTVQFEYRGRMVQVTASAKGYASALLREKPWTTRMRKTKTEHEKAALAQGQITAVETGILSFDAAFLGQILLPDGRTIHDRIADTEMLPALEAPRD